MIAVLSCRGNTSPAFEGAKLDYWWILWALSGFSFAVSLIFGSYTAKAPQKSETDPLFLDQTNKHQVNTVAIPNQAQASNRAASNSWLIQTQGWCSPLIWAQFDHYYKNKKIKWAQKFFASLLPVWYGSGRSAWPPVQWAPWLHWVTRGEHDSPAAQLVQYHYISDTSTRGNQAEEKIYPHWANP